MNIKTLQVMEIKALLFDLMTEKERIENNINILKRELEERANKKEEKTEVAEQKEKEE